MNLLLSTSGINEKFGDINLIKIDRVEEVNNWFYIIRVDTGDVKYLNITKTWASWPEPHTCIKFSTDDWNDALRTYPDTHRAVELHLDRAFDNLTIIPWKYYYELHLYDTPPGRKAKVNIKKEEDE